jgi:phosphonate transport system permease protein
MTTPTAFPQEPHTGLADTDAPLDRPCPACLIAALLVIVAVIASFVYLSIDYGALFTMDSLHSMGSFIAVFFPPDTSRAFLIETAQGALQTLAVSALSTLLAVIASVLMALGAAGRAGRVVREIIRFFLNFLRSVPELVWAALMVLAVGLGAFAATLALALHTTGVLGRLFAEALENLPAAPEQALREAGTSRTAAFVYGALPSLMPQWTAYTLYRWEMNIRMATIVGFVGGGGLGQMLYYHLSIFQQAQTATVLIALFVLVVIVDSASALLRRGLAPAYA